MDPASARAMVCASKSPLGEVFEIMRLLYFQEHRIDVCLKRLYTKFRNGAPAVYEPELPASRCIERVGCGQQRVGRGRCRKTVSKVALTQYCWKHQKEGIYSSDEKLCHYSMSFKRGSRLSRCTG